MNAAGGEAVAGQVGGIPPAEGDTGGAARQAAPPPRKPWPIWSESTRCNICGWAGEHSSVCPFGPEPTKSRESR